MQQFPSLSSVYNNLSTSGAPQQRVASLHQRATQLVMPITRYIKIKLEIIVLIFAPHRDLHQRCYCCVVAVFVFAAVVVLKGVINVTV